MLENLRDDIFLSGVTIGAIAFFVVFMATYQLKRFAISLWDRFSLWLDKHMDRYICQRRQPRTRKSKPRIKDIDTGLELYTIEAKWKGKKNEP